MEEFIMLTWDFSFSEIVNSKWKMSLILGYYFIVISAGIYFYFQR